MVVAQWLIAHSHRVWVARGSQVRDVLTTPSKTWFSCEARLALTELLWLSGLIRDPPWVWSPYGHAGPIRDPPWIWSPYGQAQVRVGMPSRPSSTLLF